MTTLTDSPALIATDSVRVYGKPACVQCDATHRAFTRQGVAPTHIDVSADPEALEFIRSLGYLQAPVVVFGDQHWSGFRRDEIAAVCAQVRAETEGL